MRHRHIVSYLYWSDRRVRAIASNNGITLDKSVHTGVKTPASIVGVPLPQWERGTDRKDDSRRKMAVKVEKAIGDQASVTLDSPAPVQFAKGVGQVSLARFIGGPARNKGSLLHIQTCTTTGQRVDLVLFGSMDNMEGWQPSDAAEDGWFSSSWLGIAEVLESRGSSARAHALLGDSEKVGVEALKIALHQGATGRHADHAGRPWTRGWTLGHARDCEWFAEIYADVVLTPGRWVFHDSDPVKGAERIMIGAPLWVRTASPESVVRYAELRRAQVALPVRGLRRFLPSRPRQAAGIPPHTPPLMQLEPGQSAHTPSGS